MATVIDKAVQWAIDIANDDSHGYDWGSRWGPDYDCATLVISAWEQAGVKVKTGGATYTGDMYDVFIKCGFSDVTSSCNLATGAGLKKGDVLLNVQRHTEMMISENQKVGAHINEKEGTYGGQTGDQTEHEIDVSDYKNYPWDYVLRYPGGSDSDSSNGGSGYNANWIEREVPNIGSSLATKSYMAYQTYTLQSAGGYSYLWGENSHSTSGGLRKYKDFFCMAFGSYYGPDGTFLKIEFDDGAVIYAVKADEKKDSETDSRHMYHKELDGGVTEFMVDGTIIKSEKEPYNTMFKDELAANGINRSARVTRIWTSDTEPTHGSVGSVTSSSGSEYHFADTNEKTPLHPTLFKQVELQCNSELKIVVNNMNISQHIGDLSWTNTKDSLATIMNFSTPKPDDMPYMNMYIPKKGDIVRYSGGTQEDFRGVIIEIDNGDKYINKYVAVDAGWYLNKTADTYQFTSMRADECIKKICGDLYVPIAVIPDLSKLITQIYIDKTISDVIKDILDKCGRGYNFDFVPNGMRIYLCSDMIAEPKFRISPNTELKSSIQLMGNIEHKSSIEDMKNSVKVITETGVVTTLKNDVNINKYGFLQEVVKMNDGDDATMIANSELWWLNREKETMSGEIIEELDSYTRAGSTIEKDGVKYMLVSCQHSIKNGVHYNKIDMERI